MDVATAKKAARLARVALKDDGEVERRAKELSGILAFVEQLAEVDTKGVEPLLNPNDDLLSMREDRSNSGDTGNSGPSRILSNAPEKTSDYFVVPKIIE